MGDRAPTTAVQGTWDLVPERGKECGARVGPGAVVDRTEHISFSCPVRKEDFLFLGNSSLITSRPISFRERLKVQPIPQYMH